MKTLILALSMFIPIVGWTNPFPVSKNAATISPELSGFIVQYGPGMGLGISAQTGIFRIQAGYNKESKAAALPPCLISHLEDFVSELPKENIDLGMALILGDYLSVKTPSQDINKYLSGNGTMNVRLNNTGLRLLSELLLKKENCGEIAPENFDTGIIKDIKISSDTAMITDENSTRSLRYLETILSDPGIAFEGTRKNEEEVWLDGNTEEASLYQEYRVSGDSEYLTAFNSKHLIKTKPPKPKKEEPRRVVRSGFWDVRWARQCWKDMDIPVVSGVMDFFAGMVQFAQDDGAIIGYEGITSPKGRKAALDFLVNSFWMVASVPSASKVITGVAANVASSIFKGGSAVIGKYRIISRFHSVTGVNYTNAEPIWIGVEKIIKGSGAGKGIIHVGFAKFQAGAHIGLNFLGETHLYLSHVYIGALNMTIPNGVIRELWKYFDNKSNTGNTLSSMPGTLAKQNQLS